MRSEVAILAIAAVASALPQPPPPPPPAPKANEYDYVIVGGGLSGLVAATRLSEDSKKTVVVLEYGPIVRTNITQIPYYGTQLNLAGMHPITSNPEPYHNGRSYAVRAGAIAGGGSQVNGMQWDLASAADYDEWEALSNPGWGWDGLQPYYTKAATFEPPPPAIQAKYNYSYDVSAYGSNSPARASFPHFQYPDLYNFKDAMDELDIPFVKEHALGNAVGQYWTPASKNEATQTRSSSLYNYYDRVSGRSNLKLLPMHQATEIIFKQEPKEQKATGVKVLDRSTNQTIEFKAKKELILAAGAVLTPHLLQLSGIGPKSVLDAAGIKTKLDFPAVGSNFQDHPTAYLNWNLTNTFPRPTELTTNATFFAEAYRLYHEKKTGPLTKAQANFVGFLSLEMVTSEASALIAAAEVESTDHLPAIYKSNPQLLAGYKAQRDLLLKDIAAGSVAVLEFPVSGGGFQPNAMQKPLSRGTVHLNATNPQGYPNVTHYSMGSAFDRASIFEYVEFSRKLFASEAMSSLNPAEVTPGPQYTTEEAVLERLISAGSLTPTFSHPSGSCPMMPKELGGVVDAELRVYGTKNLSIIDASILPVIPAAHLQASMYAVAEKASDIIKARKP